MARQGAPVKALVRAKAACKRHPEQFATDAELLRSARDLYRLRDAIENEVDEERLDEATRIERELTRKLHACITRSRAPHLSTTMQRHKLTRAEREIVLVLALSATGMVDRVRDVEDIQGAIGRGHRDALSIAQALSPEGKLAASGVVDVEDADDPILCSITLTDRVLDPLLRGKSGGRDWWGVKTYDEYLDRLYAAFKALQLNGDELDDVQARFARRRPANAPSRRRRIRQTMRLATTTAKRHPSWPAVHIFDDDLMDCEQELVVLLVGKELGYERPDDDLFTGEGLARCISQAVPDVRHALKVLTRSGSLRRRTLIRPCGGAIETVVEDEATLRSSEFELTEPFRDKLKLPRLRRRKNAARQPVVAMAQLVLSGRVRRALDMVVAQSRHARVLFDEWGFGATVTYGAGVTVLFSGPPGVGKTACAEAIARELEKRIIVANYAELQNCFVGETEKNIVRVFRDAHEDEAVLFWDEADAMFYSRDDATRMWEVRDVNVLLQQIERFEGLCVLATNRKITLDSALERRITVKVEFELPTQQERLAIWKRIIPRKLPLAKDVDLASLASHELTGGEIKNVVLNAARIALCRGAKSRVTAADFAEAIEMETAGKWSAKGRMGFASGAGTAR